MHGEFLNASSAILGNAWHSWICPTWQEEIWPSSAAWSFYSQSHKTKEFHICNNEQAQQKQRIYSSTLRLEKLCNDNKNVQGLEAALCKMSVRKNNSIRKNKSTRRHILYLKMCFLVDLFFLIEFYMKRPILMRVYDFEQNYMLFLKLTIKYINFLCST